MLKPELDRAAQKSVDSWYSWINLDHTAGKPKVSWRLHLVDGFTKTDSNRFVGRVLVIDDNWITLKLIATMLESFGLTTVISDSGEDGIQIFKSENFDLIFLDCSMPEIDGYSVAQRIRSQEKDGKHLPIIAFTANDSIENRQLCENAGMDGLLPKPYSYHSLEELLKRYLTSPAAAP